MDPAAPVPHASTRRRPATAGRRLALACILLLSGSLAHAHDAGERLDARLAGLVSRGVVLVGDGERVLYRYPRAETGSFIPASILKYAVALTALDELGAGYRFRTEVYRDERGRLLVRGYGDPMLVSEQWRRLAQELASHPRLPRPVTGLVLDDSAFAEGITIPGSGNSLNPYDANAGALVSNFNTVNVEVLGDGTVRSAEPQTPLTPVARRVAGRLGGGVHRVNLSRWNGYSLPHTGQLLRALLQEQGVEVAPSVERGTVRDGDRLLIVHRSSVALTDIIAAMMEYSSNFIANQLLLVTGMESRGEPATLSKGLSRVRDQLVNEVGIDPASFTMVEASGIGRANRITGEAMLSLLDAFAPWRGLLGHWRDTTVRMKSGTLQGVYSLAGYADAADGKLLRIVIILNQPANTRERILRELLHAFGA